MRRSALLAGLFSIVVVPESLAAAAPEDGIPNFSSRAGIAWQSDTSEGLEPSSTGPRPVGVDPVIFGKDNPYDMDTAFPVLDVANPNLLPWVADALKAQNERVLSGQPLQPRSSSCWPHGLPAYMRYNGPTFIVQSPNEVVILKNQSSEVRRILLNQPHSSQPNLSWYGESVGHYENGDTLVIDTIGVTTRTFVDNFRTPHTERLHVIERYKLAGDGKAIEISLEVDDPGAFTTKWSARQRWVRAQIPMTETHCNENNEDIFNLYPVPSPKAEKPDF
jgi:hypothetical protein